MGRSRRIGPRGFARHREQRPGVLSNGDVNSGEARDQNLGHGNARRPDEHVPRRLRAPAYSAGRRRRPGGPRSLLKNRQGRPSAMRAFSSLSSHCLPMKHFRSSLNSLRRSAWDFFASSKRSRARVIKSLNCRVSPLGSRAAGRRRRMLRGTDGGGLQPAGRVAKRGAHTSGSPPRLIFRPRS